MRLGARHGRQITQGSSKDKGEDEMREQQTGLELVNVNSTQAMLAMQTSGCLYKVTILRLTIVWQ